MKNADKDMAIALGLAWIVLIAGGAGAWLAYVGF